MRTGRARLSEWVEDIMAGEHDGDSLTIAEWTDRIMWDINQGIIQPEPK